MVVPHGGTQHDITDRSKQLSSEGMVVPHGGTQHDITDRSKQLSANNRKRSLALNHLPTMTNPARAKFSRLNQKKREDLLMTATEPGLLSDLQAMCEPSFKLYLQPENFDMVICEKVKGTTTREELKTAAMLVQDALGGPELIEIVGFKTNSPDTAMLCVASGE